MSLPPFTSLKYVRVGNTSCVNDVGMCVLEENKVRFKSDVFSILCGIEIRRCLFKKDKQLFQINFEKSFLKKA